MQNTKTEILNYCMKKTIDADMKNISQFSANVLSQDLNISRSLASQYLNTFVKEGILIKITSRPVYFLHKKTVEEQFQITLDDTVFYSLEEFIETLSEGTCMKQNFMKMVGFDASLRLVIDRLKAAMKYPSNGLPVILYGERGVGKSLLCREMFEYAMDNQLFQESAQLCKIKVYQNQEDILGTLCGDGLHKGLFELCNEGIVYLSKGQNLTQSLQQKLTKIIEEGCYYPIGSKKKIELKAHIVISVDGNYQQFMDYDFIQCFPVVCYLPTIEERYIDEKEELIIYFFKRQALQLNKKILISKNLIKTLMMNSYERNIDELKNVVEVICARANMNETSEDKACLQIKMFHLPESILLEMHDFENFQEDKVEYIDVLFYKKSDEFEKLLTLFDSILDRLLKEDSDSSIKSSVAELTLYFTTISYNEHSYTSRSKAIEQSLSYVLNKVLMSYNMTIPLHCCSLFAYYLYLLQSMNSRLHQWKEERKQDIKRCLSMLEKQYPSGKLIMEKINFALQNNLDFDFDNMNKIILLINLAYYNDSANKCKYLCIIIAHGYATASSMAEAVNTLIGSYVYDAFDMPLDTSMQDIVERLKRYIDRYTIKNDILLLVDMGSLEKIDAHLTRIDNKNIGVINNVSTRLALQIGEAVIHDCDMKTILKKAVIASTSTFSLVENKQRRDLIIFISDNGLKMANKMKDLFLNSLPTLIDVEILAVEIQNLKNEVYMEGLLNDYNLLFISGICSSIERPESFISLEDIITSHQLDHIKIHLNKYLSIREIDEFSKNLIHYFSLENVLNSLSILDAKKLLSFIEEAVNQMQLQLGRKFYGNTIVGLYIHMCCMVERLVTKEPIKNRENLDTFQVEHKDFIEIVKRSFMKTDNHYGIQISVSEISYLYDYILIERQESFSEGDF